MSRANHTSAGIPYNCMIIMSFVYCFAPLGETDLEVAKWLAR